MSEISVIKTVDDYKIISVKYDFNSEDVYYFYLVSASCNLNEIKMRDVISNATSIFFDLLNLASLGYVLTKGGITIQLSDLKTVSSLVSSIIK